MPPNVNEGPRGVNDSRNNGHSTTLLREAGLRYFAYHYYLRQKFGHRVQKVSVDAGFTCPNVDGKVAIGGCTFCDNRSFSPSRRLPRQDLLSQIDEGIRRLKRRYDCDHFQAYFQPATNTYAPVSRAARPMNGSCCTLRSSESPWARAPTASPTTS